MLMRRHHRNKESGSEEGSTSFSNDFEVKMGCDLALHFLRQGKYDQEGDIVILVSLTAYIRNRRRADGSARIAGERESDLMKTA